MSKTNTLLEKSISACVSAIEIYNKPDFHYREETFSILMINAWELLLKAKILKDNNNNINSIYVKQPKKLLNGLMSKKQHQVKITRSGNPMTIELLRALENVSANIDNKITVAFKENIIALCEIRDNAIHFKNNEPELGKTVLELGTASLKNYLNAIKSWFSKDLSKYNFYLMPLSFFHEFDSVTSFSINNKNKQLKNLLNYLSNKAAIIKSNPDSDYNLLLRIETKFIKSNVENALIVKTIRNKSDAENPEMVQEIILTEENVSDRFPWPYKDLCNKLKKRYIDFKQDKKFLKLMIDLKSNNVLCYTRRHNPHSEKPQYTYLYSSNSLTYFDKYYVRDNAASKT